MLETVLAFVIGLIARIVQDAISDHRQRAEAKERENANARMLEAGADRPRGRDELVGRLRDGAF